jgi:hypothetical protein
MTTTALAAPKRAGNRWDPTKPPFRVHAFGAGVQSMAIFESWAFDSLFMTQPENVSHDWKGFFPEGTPDLCIFADTQAEPQSVYDTVAEARSWCQDVGVPFEIVTAGDLAHPRVTKNGTQSIFTPLFTVSTEGRWEHRLEPVDPYDLSHWQQLSAQIGLLTDEGSRGLEDIVDATVREQLVAAMEARNAIPTHDVALWIPPGEHGQLRRQCTSVFKVDPMMKRVYELADDRPIEIWLGISLDEIERMKTGPNERVTYFYPLVFNQKRHPDYAVFGQMTRHDCEIYLEQIEFKASKSACVFCPYRSDYGWAKMKRNDPAAFEAACEYDERMRHARPGHECFVHRSRVPLREAYFEGADPSVIDLGLFDGVDMSQSGGCDEGYCGL